MSVRWSTSRLLSHASGDMYCGVPSSTPTPVCTAELPPPPASILASPKSSTLTNSGFPSRWISITLSGFMSRWITPAAWQAASALAICAPMRSARRTSIIGSWVSTEARVLPSRYSMMKKWCPSGDTPTSWTSTMCSLPIVLTARASWKKRCTISLLVARSLWMTLSATFLPISGCSARYTAPMPPVPILASTR